MSNDINLILVREGQSAKKKKRIKLFNNIGLGFLTITALISITFFLLNTVTSLPSIRKDQAATAGNIALLKQKTSKLLMINDRLKNIYKVTKKRKNLSPIVGFFVGETASLTTNVLEVDKNSVFITVTSDSLLDENNFLDKVMESSSKKQLIKDLMIDSLSVDEKRGKYSLSLRAKVL